MIEERQSTSDSNDEGDVDLDEVIEKIDKSLPKLHKIAAVRKKQSKRKAPSDSFPIAQMMRARAAFAEMVEDPLLTESGDDITDGPAKKISQKDAKAS